MWCMQQDLLICKILQESVELNETAGENSLDYAIQSSITFFKDSSKNVTAMHLINQLMSSHETIEDF